VVMKNWLPLVPGPALAIETVYGRSCLYKAWYISHNIVCDTIVEYSSHHHFDKKYYINTTKEEWINGCSLEGLHELVLELGTPDGLPAGPIAQGISGL